MIGLETLISAGILLALCVYTIRKRRMPNNHGLPYLESAMRGDADEEQLRELADSLAKGVIDKARSLGKPPLFVTASGDLYEDFFPVKGVGANWTALQCMNAVLSDCVVRYREARNAINPETADFGAYTLCAGAGLAVSSFRHLAGYSRDMRELAEFLAPAPAPEDRDAYAEQYRAAGELLGIPQEQVAARLAARLEQA